MYTHIHIRIMKTTHEFKHSSAASRCWSSGATPWATWAWWSSPGPSPGAAACGTTQQYDSNSISIIVIIHSITITTMI